MIPLFTKPLRALTPDDVNVLCSDEVPEGQTVEFKRTLPSKRESEDPWFMGGGVGDHARNDILKEVVAFANSGGGNVVIGIEESEQHPKRAAGIIPLPRCHELADRLRLMARDCVEPQVPGIESCGISMTGANDEGVVLIRVPPSRLAPHRLVPTRHCYVRRADRSESMTMREIQDMSVQLARGGEAIGQRIEERREIYDAIHTEPGRGMVYESGFRVTVVPASTNFHIERVYERVELRRLHQDIMTHVTNGVIQLFFPSTVFQDIPFRPILRGGMRQSSTASNIIVQEVLCDRLVDFVYKQTLQDEPIYLNMVLNFAANALLVADTARVLGGAPAGELILDVELQRQLQRSHGTKPNRHQFQIALASDDPSYRKIAGPRPLHLPQISVGGPDEFSTVLRMLFNDIRNAIGYEDEDKFEIDFAELQG